MMKKWKKHKRNSADYETFDSITWIRGVKKININSLATVYSMFCGPSINNTCWIHEKSMKKKDD